MKLPLEMEREEGEGPKWAGKNRTEGKNGENRAFANGSVGGSG